MITLTTAQNALKTVYLDAISTQLNTHIDPIFNSIKQSSADVYGKSIIKLVPFGMNGGVERVLKMAHCHKVVKLII